MAISQDQLVSLSKQVFITDYLLNGLFPCQSDIVRSVRSKKKEWKFNDKFEYRMLLANTNTGGSLNSQVFKESVGLIKPGNLEYGTYHATYGTVSDGFDVDMMINLETKDKKAAFETDYATRMHSLRNNVAALFKNFAIHGRFGVVHQIRASITAPNVGTGLNPVANVHTPVLGTPFTIKVPINVFASNFKAGKLLIKTTEAAPWGAANVAELYLVLDNQPGRLSLLPCGTAVSQWQDGEFLEVAQNREIAANSTAWQNWTTGGITVAWGAFAGTYDQFTGTGAYTSGSSSVTGAMEGFADLLPWYTNPSDHDTRLGLDMPFRDQTNRLVYSTEQAGGYVVQNVDSSGNTEHIIDAVMRGLILTTATVPYTEVGVWINPITLQQIGYEEADSVRVLRDNFTAGPLTYQRGIKSVDYQVGNKSIKNVIEDMNMPTDVIIIGPKDQMFYNCWDNSTMEIDNYIQETWGSNPPPKIQDLSIPNELITKMDISQRMTFGAPTLSDGSNLATYQYGNGFRHPKNVVPVAMHEMGALYTEYPYAYTIVKLRDPICEVTTL